MNIFEIATRQKIRFPFRGMVSVEDLWDLPLTDLDSIYKTLSAKVKATKEESLLAVEDKKDTELDIQIEIIKHIVSTKLTEKNEREQARAKKEHNQKIMSIIAAKKEAALQDMSVEDLEKMLMA